MKRILLATLMVVVVGGGAFGLFTFFSRDAGAATAASSIAASGFIEADDVSIAAEVGGRIRVISAGEGDEVTQGDILVQLDTALLNAQAQQAEASLALARASLSEEIRHAQHQLEQAIAAREAAMQAWEDAVAVRDNPQELETRIVAAQAQMEIAQRQVDMSKQAWVNAVAIRDNPQELETQIAASQAQLSVAEAQVEQATAVRDGARKAWENAVAIRDNPQELETQIIAARAQLAVAQHQLEPALAALGIVSDPACLPNWGLTPDECLIFRMYSFIPEPNHLLKQTEHAALAAQATRNGAKEHLENLLTIKENPLELKVAVDAAKTAYEQAVASVLVAQATRDGAKENLDTLLATRQDPQTLSERVDAARSQYEVAIATRDGAKENLDNLLLIKENPIQLLATANGAKSQLDQASVAERIAQANLQALQPGPENQGASITRARVVQAQAGLDLMRAQQEKMTLYSPISGVVSSVPGRAGEIASPGMPLLTLVNLDRVTLTVYVPEADIGKVKVGQNVSVTVDSYPDKAFGGYIVYIAPQAEFTPRNIQTKEERVKTVFAVKIELPNPDHALKPGMPADARINL